MQARICYKEGLLTFRHEGITVHKRLGPLPGAEGKAHQDRRLDKLVPPTRTKMIVRLPVSVKSHVREGLVESSEIIKRVHPAESLVKASDGYIITSILNTREQEVDIPKLEVQLTELEDHDRDEPAVIGLSEQDMGRGDQSLSRGEIVVDSLRTDHLNDKERKSLCELCFEYQDMFYLPGDRLSAKNAARHTIQLEPGVTPVNTRPYRIPKS